MKYYYKISSFIFLLLIFKSGYAQETTPTFTLEQCVQYALEHSFNIKNALVDEEIAKARVNETIGIGLPQIDGSVSIQHNQKLRRFFGTYIENPQPDQISFFPPGIPNAVDGDILASQNFFQLSSSGDAGITINQILFNGSYLVGLQASNSYKQLSTKATGQTKEQVVMQVSKAYYLAIINQERIKLFDSNISRVDTLLRTTKALNQNGFAEQIDVDRVQVTYNNLVTERTKFENLQVVAFELLKFQMGYPMNQSLLLTGSVEDFKVPEVQKEEVDYTKRWDFQVLNANKRLQELDVKNQYATGMPSLVAFANLGYSTQSRNISGVFKTNSAVKATDIVGPDKWYNYSLFGVSLNVPIFSGLQRTYKVQQSKLNLLKVNNSSRQLESAIDLEVKQSRINFDNSVQTMQSQKENMELASNIARVTKIKYEQGLGSNLEVVDAEAALREAQINFYNAIYDAIVAKIDLDKAYGNLYPTEENANK